MATVCDFVARALNTLDRLPQRNRVLREQRSYDVTADVGQTEAASLVTERQLFVIDPEQMENRGLQIMDVDRVLRDVISEFVSAAVGHS